MIPSTLRDPRTLGPAFLLFLGVGLFLRWSGISANLLFADDFLYFVDHSSTLINFDSCNKLDQDFRWLTMINLCVMSTYFADIATSAVPKVVSIAFLAVFATLMFACLRAWGLGVFEALLLPLVIVAHPITNEVTLWNITTPVFLFYSLPVLAYLLLRKADSRMPIIAAVLLLTTVIFSYEYALVIFLLLVLADPFISWLLLGKINWRRCLILFGTFAVFAGLYLLQTKISAALFANDVVASRGVASLADLPAMISTKFWQSFDLLVNVYMTPISFFVPLERSWSAWKWVPVAVAAITALVVFRARKSTLTAIIYGLFSGAIVFAAILPLFASTQSPESWRVAIPALIAFVLGIVPILMVASKYKWIARAVVIALIAALGVMSHAETSLRVLEQDIEENLFSEIETFWQSQGIGKTDYRVGRVLAGNLQTKPHLHSAQSLSVAYRHRGLKLNLLFDFAWRGRLLSEGFQVVELNALVSRFEQEHAGPCTSNPDLCNLRAGELLQRACADRPDHVQPATQIRIAHDVASRISAICL